MAVALNTLVEEAERYLGSAKIQDYCPNGLQVEGRPQVKPESRGADESLPGETGEGRRQLGRRYPDRERDQEEPDRHRPGGDGDPLRRTEEAVLSMVS